ncbi:MAG: hypothetical protein HY791_04300 [Deltaproteobacteria bacterium]|nr:hypothetical protein [Deltaproteobacteria bacterium]
MSLRVGPALLVPISNDVAVPGGASALLPGDSFELGSNPIDRPAPRALGGLALSRGVPGIIRNDQGYVPYAWTNRASLSGAWAYPGTADRPLG